MILQNMTIENLGAIEHFECDFDTDLNVLRTRYADEIAYALQVLLNHKDIMPLPREAVRADTKIEAALFIEKKRYKIVAVLDTEKGGLALQAYDAREKNVTNEYLYMTDHSIEQDIATFFEGTDRDMPLRFLRYANEELYFFRDELYRRTGQLSNLKVFRAYLKQFIHQFQPETVREGKQYEIVLKSDGRYAVRYRNDHGTPVCLSESEQILFRYLCFLRTAEFWRGFEEIRNLHDVKKTLIIKDFLGRLDESIDTEGMLQRTRGLERQVIILS